MIAHRVARVLMAAAAATLLSSGARADPVPLTSGFFQFNLVGSPTFLFANDEIALTGSSDPFGNIGLRNCFPCNASDPLDFSILTAGDFANGAGTVAGVPHGDLFYEGTLQFTGPEVSAATLLTDLTVTAPFLFSGTLTGYLSPPVPGGAAPLFQYDLVGQGTAFSLFNLVPPLPGGGPLFELAGATYRFEAAPPVPEPATVLLFGAGLLACARYARRARKRG